MAKLLALLYKDSHGLNKIIDKKLPSARPKFKCHKVVVAGEAFQVFYHDIIECIKALFGDLEFAPILLLAPECHYADEDKTVQVYFNMHTGKWWWATQVDRCMHPIVLNLHFNAICDILQKELEKQRPGVTILPIIIVSDKTQLMLIGNKSAYPVYMTLGNLPKTCAASRHSMARSYLPIYPPLVSYTLQTRLLVDAPLPTSSTPA